MFYGPQKQQTKLSFPVVVYRVIEYELSMEDAGLDFYLKYHSLQSKVVFYHDWVTKVWDNSAKWTFWEISQCVWVSVSSSYWQKHCTSSAVTLGGSSFTLPYTLSMKRETDRLGSNTVCILQGSIKAAIHSHHMYTAAACLYLISLKQNMFRSHVSVNMINSYIKYVVF